MKSFTQGVQLSSTIIIISQKPLKVIHAAVVNEAHSEKFRLHRTIFFLFFFLRSVHEKKKQREREREREREPNTNSLLCGPGEQSHTGVVDNDPPLYIPMASSHSDHLVVCAWQLDRQLHYQLRSSKSRQFN